MPTQLDDRQVVQRAVLPMVGNVANETLDVLLPRIDAELAKYFEDRNILLTDGGTVTFTGTQVQFTENVNLVLNQKISGAVPQIISLGSASQNFVSSGDMWVAVINRTAGTATTSIITAGNALPAAAAANQEVFLIAKRIDAADGTQRLYFRNGSAFNAGQTARLGSAGSGSGSGGAGDDLDSLQFAADFYDQFTENAANANSSVSTAFGTNATFNAAKSMYVLSYDASKTVTVTGTAVTMSAAPAYTVAVGDILIVGTVAKKITVVTSQTAYTIESAFAANIPALTTCTVSQAVYTKDINNFAVDGSALSAAFPAAFSEIMVDYKDNAITGSNVFTPGTPVIAWTGSPDNTNFTSVQKRSASELISQTSAILSSAGTSLYLRFFANESSGSGTVNLINYKAYWQKSVTAAGTTNVLWSTFAMTNNSTTPVNCSVSVVGGKTTITVTNNTYPVGLLSGQTIGALEVLLNGLSIDRFVSGSTPTTDAYYTEVSPNVIQLDRDYSSQALSISLIYSLQVIDSSTTNTSQLSALQGLFGDGFQGYVSQNTLLNATTTAGSPTSGSFYSSITNRAAIPDLTQDLKPRLGVERIAIQQITPLQNEFGSNGEPVFSAQNDQIGQIRFVGSTWTSSPGIYGQLASVSGTTDYCEVTFYGTGLNVLTGANGSSVDIRVSVDGGTEGSNVFPTVSNVLLNRNYNANTVFSLVSGLALSVHTVKVRNNNAVGFSLTGFEIINQVASGSGLVNVNPGIAYANGLKSVLGSQSQLAYNAAVVGTTGGRVVEYITAAGTRGQAFTQNASSPSYYASASHTNEEVVRTYQWREFGAGRSDDFSTIVGAARTAAFTLDDGVTSLTTQNGAAQTLNGAEGLAYGATGNYHTFTFIGTGLDIVTSTSSSYVANITASVDGSTATSLTIPVGSISTVKIVSGLPYGTHVLKLNIVSSSGGSFNLQRLVVYQPKTPTIPSGAVQIGSYNVMANYIASGSNGAPGLIGSGVLRKFGNREFLYSGTWAFTSDFTNFDGPLIVFSSTAASSFKYTFFGTGFEWGTYLNSGTYNATISVDGATNFTVANSSPTGGVGWTGALTTAIYQVGAATFTASTGVLGGTATNGHGRISISGMTLGLHTVTITYNSGNTIYADALDIITPIHSPKSNLYADFQNTLTVGSNAISDDRQTTPIKNALPATKAWAQAVGVTSSPTSSATVYVPVPDMSCTIKTGNSLLQIFYSASCYNTSGTPSTPLAGYMQIYVDGVAVGTEKQAAMTNSADTQLADMVLVPVSAGVHKVDVYWHTGSGSIGSEAQRRTLTVKEN